MGGNLFRSAEYPKAVHAPNLLISDGVVQRYFPSGGPRHRFFSALFESEQEYATLEPIQM
jgi:hypothetical protein